MTVTTSGIFYKIRYIRYIAVRSSDWPWPAGAGHAMTMAALAAAACPSVTVAPPGGPALSSESVHLTRKWLPIINAMSSCKKS